MVNYGPFSIAMLNNIYIYNVYIIAMKCIYYVIITFSIIYIIYSLYI